MTTGQKITSLRKKANITQEQLADLVKVSRQSVSKWESDLAYPETEKIISLSRIFNCSIDYLLRNDPNDNENSLEGEEKSKKNLKHKRFRINKTGMPLSIANFSLSIFSFIVLAISAVNTQVYLTGFGTIYRTINFYNFVFTSNYLLGNIPFLMTFLSLFIIIILSILYFFNKNHGIYLSLKILTTCLAFFYCLSLGVVSDIANSVFYICAILYIIYVVVMWVIKPFRFSQKNNAILQNN